MFLNNRNEDPNEARRRQQEERELAHIQAIREAAQRRIQFELNRRDQLEDMERRARTFLNQGKNIMNNMDKK